MIIVQRAELVWNLRLLVFYRGGPVSVAPTESAVLHFRFRGTGLPFEGKCR